MFVVCVATVFVVCVVVAGCLLFLFVALAPDVVPLARRVERLICWKPTKRE